MKLSVQADNLKLFKEALSSRCNSVRLGSEFCEYLLPSLGELEEAYELAHQAGKEFTYVTPRLSNAGIEKLREQLAFLHVGVGLRARPEGEIHVGAGLRARPQGEISVVFNDLGALNILGCYPNLRPHLGRHMLLVPARSLWVEQHMQRKDLSSQRRQWLRSLFSSTSLNYRATIELYRSYGCQRADIDWLPRIFPSLAFLVENGLRLSVHLHLVPVTFTRKCHMARFLGEASPEECSKPCLDRAFLLRNEAFGLQLYLHGNAAFRLVQPSPKDVPDLEKHGVTELVLTMNPLTRIDSAERIDNAISDLEL